MPTNLDNAWAAGIVDGEGCITISRQRAESNVYYRLRVAVGQSGEVLPKMLAKLQKDYGGTIEYKRHMDKRGGRRPAWMWGVVSRQAEQFLRFIYPFLIEKTEQATLALKYRDDLRGKRQRTPERRSIHLQFYTALHNMKRSSQ